jgi:hypothetical protein
VGTSRRKEHCCDGNCGVYFGEIGIESHTALRHSDKRGRSKSKDFGTNRRTIALSWGERHALVESKHLNTRFAEG